MRHGSLFSGIGGFDLAAEWMGWENVFHCEWNPFGQKVLKYYWPNAESFSDITKTDFTKYEGQIDIISGGFPCQPYSSAGKRKGKEDERHLWPEMLRTIREVKPSFVVGENVRGLTNWNGGMVFDEVCSELEALGYQVAPVIIPACGLNSPHKRERIWFVAYCCSIRQYTRRAEQSLSRNSTDGKKRNATNTNGNGFNECNINNEINTSQGRINAQCDIEQSNDNGNASNTHSTNNKTQSQERLLEQKNKGRKTGRFINGHTRTQWNEFPTQSPVCGGDDGLPTELDGITFSKWRAESIKGYGNAIVPQVALQIFKAIEKTIKQ